MRAVPGILKAMPQNGAIKYPTYSKMVAFKVESEWKNRERREACERREGNEKEKEREWEENERERSIKEERRGRNKKEMEEKAEGRREI